MQLREQAGKIRQPYAVQLETVRWDHTGVFPEVKVAQYNWLIKVSLLRAQECFTLMGRTSKVWGRRLAWLSPSIKKKKSAQKVEEVQSTWQEYSDLGQACRGGVRRVKTQWSFKPAKDMKGNKNNFYKYINSKSMANAASTLSGAVDPTIKHREKSVAFSDLVFTGMVWSPASQVLVPTG